MVTVDSFLRLGSMVIYFYSHQKCEQFVNIFSLNEKNFCHRSFFNTWIYEGQWYRIATTEAIFIRFHAE